MAESNLDANHFNKTLFSTDEKVRDFTIMADKPLEPKKSNIKPNESDIRSSHKDLYSSIGNIINHVNKTYPTSLNSKNEKPSKLKKQTLENGLKLINKDGRLPERSNIETSSDDLRDFDDKILFPGNSFDTSTKVHHKNFSLSDVSDDKYQEFKSQIIEKYSKRGTISTFKGKQEMSKFKEKIAFKNELKSFYDYLNSTKASIADARQRLQNEREFNHNSKMKLDKIIEELDSMFVKNNISGVFNENRYCQTVFPKNQALMIQSRYRELLKYYAVHSKIFQSSEINIPIINQDLAEKRQILQDLTMEEYALKPKIDAMEEDDEREYVELNIVARERALRYKKEAPKPKPKKTKEKRLKQSSLARPTIIETANNEHIVMVSRSLLGTNPSSVEESSSVCVPDREIYHTPKLNIKDVEKNRFLPNYPRVKTIEEKKMDIVKKVLDELHPVQKKRQLTKMRTSMSNFKRPAIKLFQKHPNEDEKDTLENIIDTIKELEQSYNNQEIVPQKRRIPLVKIKPAISEKPNIDSNSIFHFEPPLVNFSGCTSKTEETILIKVINTTGIPNAFRIKYIPEIIAQNITVDYTPGIKLSPGEFTTMKITFQSTDQVFNQGIFCFSEYLTLMAQYGGEFKLCLRFSAAVCLPLISSVTGSGGEEITFLNPNQQKMMKHSKLKSQFAQVSENILDLDFGTCFFGNITTFYVQIKNEGTLASKFLIQLEDSDQMDEAEMNNALNSFEAACTGPETVIIGKGEITIRVTFKPIEPYEEITSEKGKQYTTTACFHISFQEMISPIVINCSGIGKSKKVFSDRSKVDYHWCVPNMKYEDQVIIYNKYRISRKLTLDFGDDEVVTRDDSKIVCPPYFGCVEVSPGSSYIQSESTICLWIKVQFTKQLAKELDENNQSELNYTFKVLFSDPSTGKEYSFPISLYAKIILYEIRFHSSNLNFGGTSTIEAKELQLELTNISKYPQTMQCSESENFKVKSHPADPGPKLIELNPMETTTRTVVFEPKKGGRFSEMIRYRTSWNDVFEIECRGIGYSPPLLFDREKLHFESTTFGSTKTCVFRLLRNENPTDENGDPILNSSAQTVQFEILKPIFLNIEEIGSDSRIRMSFLKMQKDKVRSTKLPPLTEADDDFLQIWPIRGILQPGETRTIAMTVEIPSNFQEIKQPQPKQSADETRLAPKEIKPVRKDTLGKKKEEPKLPEGPNLDDSPEHPFHQLSPFQKELFSFQNCKVSAVIPCISHYKVSESEYDAALLQGKALDAKLVKDTTQEQVFSRITYMHVEIPIYERAFEVLEPKDGILDFEYLSSMQQKTKFIVIKNINPRPIEIKQIGLPPYGPFYLGKALRKIPPQQTMTVPITFTPNRLAKFSIHVDFYYRDTRSTIHMKGIAVNPKLELSETHLNFGDVCVGDQSHQSFKVTNPCPVDLNFLVTLESDKLAKGDTTLFGDFNFSGASPFIITNQRYKIPANSTSEITVKFLPDKEHDNFFDSLNVKIIGLDVQYAVKLHGKGWEISAIVASMKVPLLSSSLPFLYPPKLELERNLQRLGLTLPDENSKKDKDEIPPELYVGTQRKVAYYSVITTNWIQVPLVSDPNRFIWAIAPLEIQLSNLKPTFKMDAVKKGAITEYNCEPISETLIFDETIQQFIFSPKTKQIPSNIGANLVFDPPQGTIELGTTKSLRLELDDPTCKFWNNCKSSWEKLSSRSSIMKHSSHNSLGYNSNNSLSHIMNSSRDHSDMIDKRLAKLEIIEPIYMEQVFRISFKGAYRFVEPKGPQLQQEPRVFYVLVKVNVDK
jgi:hypothetical protein